MRFLTSYNCWMSIVWHDNWLRMGLDLRILRNQKFLTERTEHRSELCLIERSETPNPNDFLKSLDPRVFYTLVGSDVWDCIYCLSEPNPQKQTFLTERTEPRTELLLQKEPKLGSPQIVIKGIIEMGNQCCRTTFYSSFEIMVSFVF